MVEPGLLRSYRKIIAKFVSNTKLTESAAQQKNIPDDRLFILFINKRINRSIVWDKIIQNSPCTAYVKATDLYILILLRIYGSLIG
jgi:hypothetical protein